MTKWMSDLCGFGLGLAFGGPSHTTFRVRVAKTVLWFFAGIAASVAVVRFLRGLGATTALSDTTPWGLWIGFDVLCGVALAAGGFVIAATVYIFHLERYRPILRPAVLTAFLGYAAVVVGLLFDLGLPWQIWRPVFHWQHHSALFEVAWCVMLYFTVLALEVAPTVLERAPFPGLYRFLKRLTLPLVILGIMLSTLHQSSLGTLFLIMPSRLHPLWYSPVLPQLFLVSAVGLGLAMVILESLASSWLYRRKPESHLLGGLSRAAVWVLALYAAVRFGDLAFQGKLGLLAGPGWETALFWFEMLLSTIAPAVLFALPRVRKNAKGLAAGAAMVVLGFVLNRIDVSGLATLSATGSRYFPSWTEFAVSIGIVSAMALLFLFVVERFPVYATSEEESSAVRLAPPKADPVSQVRLHAPWAGNASLYSWTFVLAAALGLALLSEEALHGARPLPTPVEPVRRISPAALPLQARAVSTSTDPAAGTVPEPPLLPAGAQRGLLHIDGDRNGRFVLFDHEGHRARMADEEACGACHHMSHPLDSSTPCTRCHRDMFLETSIFDHERHVKKLGGNDACAGCHPDRARPKSEKTAAACLSCHPDMPSNGSLVEVREPERFARAPGYQDALHGLCIGCHEKETEKEPALGSGFAQCGACHSGRQENALPGHRPAPERVVWNSAGAGRNLSQTKIHR